LNDRRTSFLLPSLVLLAVIFLVFLTWVNARFAAQDSGMNAFLPGWAGTRWFLTRGWSPYSTQTTQEIQSMAYGRPAQSDESQGVFLYPLYSTLVFAPFALVGDYITARALWMTVLEIALLGLLWVSISLTRWQPSGWMVAVLLFFSFFWYPGIRPILSGDISILCVLCLTLAFLAIRADHDSLAGILLAFASIEPRVVLLPVLFIMVWAATQRRWVLFGSPFLVILLLVATTSLFIPDWIWQNLQQLAGFLKQTFRTTPGSVITYWLPGVGVQLGRGLTIAMIGMLLWEWVQAAGKDIRWFLWTVYLTQVGTFLVGIDISLGNQISLLPALILVLATWDERWGKLGRFLNGLSIPVLSLGMWAAALNEARQQVPPYLDPVLVFFLPFFLLAGLYWVRWWAIRPPRLYVEMLSRHLSG
jgi:hypothetical protein